MTSFFSAEGDPIWNKFRRLVDTEWHVDCGDVWKWKPYVEFQYGRRLGEFNGMSSQSHVSHCRVLPLGEYIVMIPEPVATLQGAVTWRNQCRDRAVLQGVRIPSAILNVVFLPYFFLFLMQFRLWQAAAYVSSPIHLLIACCWRHKIPQTSNLQLAYSIMMSKTAVQKRPITVPVWGGCDVLWGGGAWAPQTQA